MRRRGKGPRVPEPPRLATNTTPLSGCRKFKALGLLVPALVLNACGAGGAPTSGATALHTESPIATESETASATPIKTTEATATVEPAATPFVVPPVDSITNPNPSEIPQSPVTTAQVKADISKVVSDSGSVLTQQDVETQLDGVLAVAADKTRDPSLRIGNYGSLVAIFYGYAGKTLMGYPTAQQEAYQTAFDVYQLALGPNGMGPSAKPQIDSLVQQATSLTPRKTP